MAISYGSTTQASSADTTSHNFTSPSGGTSDVLVIMIDAVANAGASLTVTGISGGSLTYTQRTSTINYNTNSNFYCYTAPTTSSSAVTVNITTNRSPDSGAGQGVDTVIHRYGGVDTTGAIGNVSNADNGQSTTYGGGSITVTAGNTSILHARQKDNFGQTFTPPTNWTERYDPGTSRTLVDRIGVPSTTTYDPQVTSTSNWFDSFGWHLELVAAAGGAANRPPSVLRPQPRTVGSRTMAHYW